MGPSRRDVLERCASVAALAAGAGCSGALDGTPTSSPTGSVPSATDTPTETGSPASARALDLDRASYLVRGFPVVDAGEPVHEATPVAEFPEPARRALSTAIREGTYTTSDPSRTLLDAVEGVSMVRTDGTYYTLSHTFTEYVLDLATDVDPAAAPDSRTVAWDDERVQAHPSVEAAVTTVVPFGVEAPGEEYRTLVRSPELASFLETYDYVEYPRGVGRLDYHVVQQFPPHTLSARPASDEALYGEPVIDPTALSSVSRRLLRAAVTTHRPTPLDPTGADGVGTVFRESVPLELESAFDDGALVRLEDTVYSVRVDHRHWERQPFALSARLADADTDAGDAPALELSVRNRAPHPAVLTVPGLLPFGLLWAVPRSGGEPVQLWSPAYESSELVEVTDGVARPASYQHDREVASGERVSRTYRVGRDPDRVAAGTYTVPGLLWPRWPTEAGQDRVHWNSAVFPYELSLVVPA